jgi:hypothetical protein
MLHFQPLLLAVREIVAAVRTAHPFGSELRAFQKKNPAT